MRVKNSWYRNNFVIMAVSLGERGLIRGGSGSKLGGKYIYLILVGAFSLGRQCVAVTCNKKVYFLLGYKENCGFVRRKQTADARVWPPPHENWDREHRHIVIRIPGRFGSLCDCPMTCHRSGHIVGTAPTVTLKVSGAAQLSAYITGFRKRELRSPDIFRSQCHWYRHAQPIAANGTFRNRGKRSVRENAPG